MMEQLQAEKQPGDLVFVDIAAKAPFDFYTELTGQGRDGVILFATPEEIGGQLQRGGGAARPGASPTSASGSCSPTSSRTPGGWDRART